MPTNPGEGLLLYKEQGQHLIYVKIRGRWYRIGGPGQGDAIRAFDKAAAEQRAQFRKTNTIPTPVAQAYASAGKRTYQVIVDALPEWTPAVGF